MTFRLQYKKPSWGHNIPLYTLNILLVKTQKSIHNDFCDVFVQFFGIKEYLVYIGTSANVQIIIQNCLLLD